MKIYKINITGYKEKNYNVFNVDLEKAKKHLKYKINSIEKIDIDLDKKENSYDIINEKGFLETIYTDKMPSRYSKEDWATIRSFQKTQGSIDIPFKDILGY